MRGKWRGGLHSAQIISVGDTEMSHSVSEDQQDFSRTATAFAQTAERTLACGEASQIDGGDLESVLTAAMKLYAAKVEGATSPPPPVSADALSPTEAVVVISETMRALNLNLFDLSMWYRRGERT
jgi:hypothetical protein